MRTLELTEVADTLAGLLAAPADAHDALAGETRWRVASLPAHGVELEGASARERPDGERGARADGVAALASGQPTSPSAGEPGPDGASDPLAQPAPPAWVYVGTCPVLAPGCGRAEAASLAALTPGDLVTLAASAPVRANAVSTRLLAHDSVRDAEGTVNARPTAESSAGTHDRPADALARPRLERAARAAVAVLALEAPVAASDVTDDEALAALLGLGPGLTLSGDDALVALAARHRALTGEAAPWLAGILARLDSEPEATTAASAAYLRHAAAGHVSRPLARVVTEFARTQTPAAEAASPAVDPENLRADVEALLAVGATSGADALAAQRLTNPTTPDSAR